MNLARYFPIWDQLTPAQQKQITDTAMHRTVQKGTLLHNGLDCTGLFLIASGQLRAYILSEEGREITLYRLRKTDVCLFSASCILNRMHYDVLIEAEKDTQFWLVPADVYKKIMEESVSAANYTNQIMADRFSEVLWLMEQILWKSLDKRLAAFLLEEAALEETTCLKITHETIGKHVGSAREVVTRMLHYFQHEGMVKLTRGSVEIMDKKRLEQISNAEHAISKKYPR